MKHRIGQLEDETAIEYLRRAVGSLSFEPESQLEQLETAEALLDYFDLWHVYGTEFWTGVLEGISSGDSPRAARAFVEKWKLGQAWTDDIEDAISDREENRED